MKLPLSSLLVASTALGSAVARGGAVKSADAAITECFTNVGKNIYLDRGHRYEKCMMGWPDTGLLHELRDMYCTPNTLKQVKNNESGIMKYLNELPACQNLNDEFVDKNYPTKKDQEKMSGLVKDATLDGWRTQKRTLAQDTMKLVRELHEELFKNKTVKKEDKEL